MKYYLSIDKGPFYKRDEQYYNLAIKNIKPELGQNNNFKLLCEFTMLFPDEKALKEYLVERKLFPTFLKHFDLKITYEFKGNTFSLAIPFSSEEKYFHVNYLASILINKKDDFEFLNNFLKRIRFHAGLPEEFYLLKQYVNERYVKDPIEAIIKSFITGVCYQKGKLNFRGLYDIAMILASMAKEPKKETSGLEASYMSEEVLFEAEERQSRLVRRQKDNPDQLSLF